MQNDEIFDCKSDLQWVEKKLESVKKIRGYRSQMAHAAQCQPAYLSQVLSGKVLFTMEQADGLCGFWNLDHLQSEFWLNLVQLSRSGTLNLSKRVKQRLESIKSQHSKKSRSEIEVNNKRIFKENTLKYYSHWTPTAIHMLWLIPEYCNNIKATSQRLNINETEVGLVLNLLVELGLLELKNEKYRVTSNHLHISNESLYSTLHHKNWRTQAMQGTKPTSQNHLHYTSIYSLDKKTLIKLTQKIREFLAECDQDLKKAPDTTIACMNIDFFEI